MIIAVLGRRWLAEVDEVHADRGGLRAYADRVDIRAKLNGKTSCT